MLQKKIEYKNRSNVEETSNNSDEISANELSEKDNAK
jgi:hypothetical protein